MLQPVAFFHSKSSFFIYFFKLLLCIWFHYFSFTSPVLSIQHYVATKTRAHQARVSVCKSWTELIPSVKNVQPMGRLAKTGAEHQVLGSRCVTVRTLYAWVKRITDSHKTPLDETVFSLRGSCKMPQVAVFCFIVARPVRSVLCMLGGYFRPLLSAKHWSNLVRTLGEKQQSTSWYWVVTDDRSLS